MFADIQGDDPIPDLSLLAKRMDHPDAVVLGVFESDGTGGGRSVSRRVDPVDMLLAIAEILQDECSETSGGWGQARPPCPHHPHPAAPPPTTEKRGGFASGATSGCTGSAAARCSRPPRRRFDAGNVATVRGGHDHLRPLPEASVPRSPPCTNKRDSGSACRHAYTVAVIVPLAGARSRDFLTALVRHRRRSGGSTARSGCSASAPRLGLRAGPSWQRRAVIRPSFYTYRCRCARVAIANVGGAIGGAGVWLVDRGLRSRAVGRRGACLARRRARSRTR